MRSRNDRVRGAAPSEAASRRCRAGVVVCPIWGDLGLAGEYLILVHFIRDESGGVQATAAFTRYNGELTDITDKFRTLKILPDWRERISQCGRKENKY